MVGGRAPRIVAVSSFVFPRAMTLPPSGLSHAVPLRGYKSGAHWSFVQPELVTPGTGRSVLTA
jgi:hypothetical protein